MFVLEALVLTFVTTPLVTWLYPPQYRVRTAATGANFNNVTDGETGGGKSAKIREESKTRFTVILDRFEHLPGMMALTQLVNPSVIVSAQSEEEKARQPTSNSVRSFARKANQVVVEALRVVELSDRLSAVMKGSAFESVLRSDPLLSAFRMFGTLNDMKIIPSLSIVKHDELAYTIVEHARNTDSDMIMLPWLPPIHDPYSGNHPHPPPRSAAHHPKHPDSGAVPPTSAIKSPGAHNPFDALFRTGIQAGSESSASVTHSQFVRAVFSQATTDVALFVDQSTFHSSANSAQHLFLPFFGGPDDRAALELVMQLVENPRVSATVVKLTQREQDEFGEVDEEALKKVNEQVNALTIASVSSSVIFSCDRSLTSLFPSRRITLNSRIPSTASIIRRRGFSRILLITFSGQNTPIRPPGLGAIA